ncbi:hypothetical protein Ae201684P_014141 [Aphanomyces euteiches]|uniref:Uncharacterized protein n=1 Tax=Aphanomyces euteiches TaxID=100861 RepID=A0A6G0WR87_9STRA|nr:hypothetical protein Ae201684_012578 [Aphanomyces euteiches]KAH9090335.1 hypothetical protein Ae201684P_014141 [Aphanomyces euteiches]KAH9136233.1 hypothetical protein AeRB84_018534 [Aphanomyces euteiches]
MDEALLKEVVRLGPYEVGHGNVMAAWNKAALAMSDFDSALTGRSCQAKCDNLLASFERSNKASLRASGDILDGREEIRQRKIRKRDEEKDRTDQLEVAGERACNDAEERVAKRMALSSKSNETSQKKESKSDPIDQLLAFERKRHEDDHAYRMERLEFERNEQQQRRIEQRHMTMLLEKLINKLTD